VARVVVHSKLNAMRRNGAGGDDALTWRAYDARVLSVTESPEWSSSAC
jgi:hypothetical protein